MILSTPIEMNRFSIKDIENLTGIKAHTIRIWEQRYGILQPKRTATNIRYYDAADLKNALRISLLNNFGYKISRIHQMTEEDMSTLIQKISDADFKLQIRTNELLEAALSMNVVSFEQILNENIRKRGVEANIEGLVFQFLEKIGIMWVTNHLIPAQEHLASNVLYRKLAVAIDHLPLNMNGARVLVFLPEGEVHEIGLMYVQYLLRKSGKLPVYLGANTPLAEVAAAFEVTKPAYVYTHLTSVAEAWDGNRYLSKLSELMPDARILVSGAALHKKKYTPGRNTRFLHSLAEVRDAIIAL
jgi:DNA-binding transcriptional MerR regulator